MASTQQSEKADRPTIILVHGAFADGSCWQKVIPLLQDHSFKVIAVQNPLNSFEDDVATTKRALDTEKGPVVLVGHSYGGAVITVAATGNSEVKALVYIAAFAPDVGDSLGSLLGSMTPSAIGPALKPDAGGFLHIDPERFQDVFMNDLPPEEARVPAVTQKPIFGPIFDTRVPSAAWKAIPSWYLVSSEDHAINPDLQRFMAKRIGAKTSEVKASHVSFLSNPEKVVGIIEEAAKSVAGRAVRGAA